MIFEAASLHHNKKFHLIASSWLCFVLVLHD